MQEKTKIPTEILSMNKCMLCHKIVARGQLHLMRIGLHDGSAFWLRICVKCVHKYMRKYGTQTIEETIDRLIVNKKIKVM